MTLVEPFSSGYYIGEFEVEEFSGETAALPVEECATIEYQVYYGFDMPLLFKIGNRHVPVQGQAGIPSDTLALPSDIVDSADLSVSELTTVLIAKKSTAQQIMGWESFTRWYEAGK